LTPPNSPSDLIRMTAELISSGMAARMRLSLAARLRRARLGAISGLCAVAAVIFSLAAGDLALAPRIGLAASVAIDAVILGILALGFYVAARRVAAPVMPKRLPTPLNALLAEQVGAMLKEPNALVLITAVLAGVFAAGFGRRD